MAVHQLVAKFLKDNQYHETLKIFEKEYGKPIVQTDMVDENLEDIVSDRINYNNLDKDFDNLEIDEFLDKDLKNINANQLTEWTSPYPQHCQIFSKSIAGLVISSCMLSQNDTLILLVSTANLELVAINIGTKDIIFKQVAFIGKVVIKKIININDEELLIIGMDGMVHWYHIILEDSSCKFEKISAFQAHVKLITDAKVIHFNNDSYLITLGWDFLLKVFKLENGAINFTSEAKLAVQGSCFDVTVYNNQVVIILGKNENTLLEVFVLNNNNLKLCYKISLNDAEFTSSSFSPRCISIQNISNSIPLIAVGTSHEPFMRLIVVSLKELPIIGSPDHPPVKRNQILKNINSLSPQDKYSQALIAWRYASDKTPGVWIIGEDGKLRGIDLQKNEVLIEINAHVGKIKNFSSGLIHNEEILATFGVDKEIKFWLS